MTETAKKSMAELLREYHASHDCDPGACECKCGCTIEMGCRAMANLCSVCQVKWGRDYEEHGPKDDATWTAMR